MDGETPEQIPSPTLQNETNKNKMGRKLFEIILIVVLIILLIGILNYFRV